ncbi:MAG: PAS domain S-box protein [Burkholderiaceae bacterium]
MKSDRVIMPTTPTERPPSPSAESKWEWNARSNPNQRRWVLTSTVAIIATIFMALAVFVWREHEIVLDKSGERAERQAEGLTRDLEQTLTVARTLISQVDAQIQVPPETASGESLGLPASTSFSSLLASLPLPFDLHAIGEQGKPIAIIGQIGQTPAGVPDHYHPDGHRLAPERWTLSHNDPVAREQFVPLAWKSAVGSQGVDGYGVDLSLDALQAWLERERIEADDRVSLFWMNADGTATLLARAPKVASEPGQRVRAPWVDKANQSSSGMVDQLSALDRMERRAAFKRLSGPASDLAIVYGIGTEMALAEWRRDLPYFVGLALCLAGAMSYGAWRLDRSLRALTRSERSFQLVLDSGQVWDWNINTNTVRYTPTYLGSLDNLVKAQDDLSSTFFSNVVEEDLIKLKASLKAHFKFREPYHTTFRIRDPSGNTHWMETRGQALWDENGRAQYMAGTTLDVSDRIALEEERDRTLQQLDAVANASSVLFWTANLEGEASWFNRRWLAFTGHTEEQDLGHGWLDSVHPDDHARKQALLALMRAQQESVSAELRLRNREGAYRWMMVQCLPLKNADQETTGYIGSCVDVSDLKSAENAAHQRGAMLETVFNVLQDLLFVVDEAGHILHFQGIAEEYLYAPHATFLGKPFRSVIPSDVADLLQYRLTLAKSGQLQEFDYRLTLPDGPHHFDARMARLPGSEHYMIVARDITERDKLQQRSERLQQFMTLQARLATPFHQPAHPAHQPGDRQRDGRDRPNGPSRPRLHLRVRFRGAHGDEHPRVVRPRCSTHDDGAASPQSRPVSRVGGGLPGPTDGERRRCQPVAARPLRELLTGQDIQNLITLPLNSGDTCLGFVGFDSVQARHEYSPEQIDLLKLFAQMLVNVYGRKAAHDELQRLARELEQRVEERTAQLDVSVCRLEQANQELDSFAYSVSHDLKSPLRSVEGFASLLLEEHSASLNDEGQDYLRRIQSASLHMARLINDLLAYCRMEDMDSLIAPVSLSEVVGEVLGGMRNELEAHRVEVHQSVPSNLRAMANPQGLAMVLRNLADNAIKFARPGHPPVITLTARQTDHTVRLCLADQGRGFDMKYHDRIFALFQRLHRPEAIAGTGIGLAMVHKAVLRMNGRIWAESAPGQGAKFHIELPLA